MHPDAVDGLTPTEARDDSLCRGRHDTAVSDLLLLFFKSSLLRFLSLSDVLLHVLNEFVDRPWRAHFWVDRARATIHLRDGNIWFKSAILLLFSFPLERVK